MPLIEYSPSDQEDDGNAEHYAAGAHLTTSQDLAERAAHAELLRQIRAAVMVGDDARVTALLTSIGYTAPVSS